MRILTGLTFTANIALWILGITIGFVEEAFLGAIVLIGFIGFLIGWYLSGGIVTSPADYFFQPEWTVFKTKLKWANGIGITTGLVALLVLFIISEL